MYKLAYGTHATVRQLMKTTLAAMKHNYDLRNLERSNLVDNVIYILDTAVSKGQCRKLGHPWRGPGEITSMLASFIFVPPRRHGRHIGIIVTFLVSD